jgi:purine nucleosidase
MGGAIGEGNITPAAEFNIYFDPIAARETLSYGIPFTMVPLELTHTNQANLAVLEKFKKYQSPFAKCVVQLIEAYRGNYFTVYGLPHPPLHDPCAVFYLLEKEAFKGRHVNCILNTGSSDYRHFPDILRSNQLQLPVQ